MAYLIAIEKPGSKEPGFIVSGVRQNDGSVKSYFAFSHAKILALHDIFQQIIRDKTRIDTQS